MNTYFKIKSYCLKGLEIVTCVALLGLLTVLLVQIVSRLLKCPVTGTMTYANMLLMWVAFPAACLGIDKKMQLGVDVLYNILPVGKKGLLDIVSGMSIALFAVLAMCYGGSVISLFLLKNSEFIRFMFYLPLVLSGCIMTLLGMERFVLGVYRAGFAKGSEE